MDPALVSLLAASVAFVGSHFALSHPLRAPLVGALGENGFRILYSLVALATFIWAATAFRSVGAGGTPLWDGMSDAIWIVVTIIMLVASVLLAGSFVRNPALPDARASRNAALPVHGVFHVTRHPMMWSFALWAAAHVLVSPTPRQWIMAGAIGNLYDNFTQESHGVRDFLRFQGSFFGQSWEFPAFNVADSCICVGAITLAILMWRGSSLTGPESS